MFQPLIYRGGKKNPNLQYFYIIVLESGKYNKDLLVKKLNELN
jgi:hypothetical protein